VLLLLLLVMLLLVVLVLLRIGQRAQVRVSQWRTALRRLR